jgi:hypothetical protein
LANPALKSIAAFEAPGWAFQDDCGYYIHAGRVYLQGAINNNDGYPVVPITSTTILTGLPPAIRPTSDQPVVLFVDVFGSNDTITPGVHQPLTPLAATVTTSGELRLDVMPPYLNVPPPDPPYRHIDATTGLMIPDFTGGIIYTIALGNASWLLHHEVDSYPTKSFDPYLAFYAFDDIDSTIDVHGTRVHLGGRVRVTQERPFSLSLYGHLPEEFLAGITPDDSFFSYTIAHDSDGVPYVLKIYGEEKLIGIEQDSVSTPWPAPPAWGVNGWGDIRTTGYWVPSGLYDWEGLADTGPESSEGLRWTPGAMRGQRMGGGALDGNGDVFALGVSREAVSWDHGAYWVSAHAPNMGGFHYDTTCPQAGPSGHVTASISDLLEDFYPLPDWFAVYVIFETSWQNYTTGQGDDFTPWMFATCGVFGTDSHAAPVSADADCILVNALDGTDTPTGQSLGGGDLPLSNPLAPTPFAGTWPNHGYAFGSQGDGGSSRQEGMLARPGRASAYPYDPNRLSTALLWKPDEINDLTLRLDGETNAGTVGITLQVLPFWEQRRHWLKVGDVLDLTGAGWQSPSAPGQIFPGPVDAGVVRLRSKIPLREQYRISGSGLAPR